MAEFDHVLTSGACPGADLNPCRCMTEYASSSGCCRWPLPCPVGCVLMLEPLSALIQSILQHLCKLQLHPLHPPLVRVLLHVMQDIHSLASVLGRTSAQACPLHESVTRAKNINNPMQPLRSSMLAVLHSVSDTHGTALDIPTLTREPADCCISCACACTAPISASFSSRRAASSV